MVFGVIVFFVVLFVCVGYVCWVCALFWCVLVSVCVLFWGLYVCGGRGQLKSEGRIAGCVH